MAKTIPGGAYIGQNGQWHDANGKSIKSPFEADAPIPEPKPAETAPKLEPADEKKKK